ncbi:MAG: hypothetical protein ACI915_004287 [Gammaproteobacteria bacterium]|jgi:hypothetical protein
MNKKLTGTFFAILVGVSLEASAALSSVDSSFGNNTLTHDSVSGLEWLDVAITSGNSYDTVATQIGSGLIYEGFRFATRQEVYNLWDNAGLAHYLTGTGSQPNGDVNTFAGFLGNTANDGGCLSCVGPVGFTAVESGVFYQYGAYTTSNFGPAPSVDNPFNAGDNPVSNITGSWLVAANPVPVPVAVWLFGSGLIGLVGFARRK